MSEDFFESALRHQFFESALRRDGFAVSRRVLRPGTVVAEHAESFDMRALVVDGEVTLSFDGCDYAYRTGDVFVMPAGVRHAQTVGADGVDYVVGRRDVDAGTEDESVDPAQMTPPRIDPVTDRHV
jgi:quercetin dioxygenase-like cupin family protein